MDVQPPYGKKAPKKFLGLIGEIKYFETPNEESEGVDSKKIKLDRWYM